MLRHNQIAFVALVALLSIGAAAAISQRSVGAWVNQCVFDAFTCLNIEKFSPFGYPNFGGFEASVASASPSNVQTDALVSLVSTVGMPSVWLGYYSSRSNFVFDLNWLNMSLDIFSGNIHGAASVSTSSSSTGMAIRSVFEFVDVNNNSRYDPKVDTMVTSSRYDFLSLLQPAGHHWKAMTLSNSSVKADNGAAATLYTFNATTVDGVVSIQVRVSFFQKSSVLS